MSGIPAWAVRGARVVCVHEVPDFGPRLREICTISGVDIDRKGCWLFLEGYDDWVPTAPGQNTRHSFLPRNFRPLVSTKSKAEDLAMFRDLIRQPEGIDA
jgi:hypothetical protein